MAEIEQGVNGRLKPENLQHAVKANLALAALEQRGRGVLSPGLQACSKGMVRRFAHLFAANSTAGGTPESFLQQACRNVDGEEPLTARDTQGLLEAFFGVTVEDIKQTVGGRCGRDEGSLFVVNNEIMWTATVVQRPWPYTSNESKGPELIECGDIPVTDFDGSCCGDYWVSDCVDIVTFETMGEAFAQIQEFQHAFCGDVE